MSIGEICAVGVIASAAVMLLRDSGTPHPEAIVLILGVIVVGRAVAGLGVVVAFVSEISEDSTVSSYVTLMLKAAGIAYVADFASGICRDSGSSSVGEYVNIAAKTEILLLSIPVVRELLALSLGMLS